jgi:hypothetical protein
LSDLRLLIFAFAICAASALGDCFSVLLYLPPSSIAVAQPYRHHAQSAARSWGLLLVVEA